MNLRAWSAHSPEKANIQCTIAGLKLQSFSSGFVGFRSRQVQEFDRRELRILAQIATQVDQFSTTATMSVPAART
jgi:hypothetical protein